MVYLKHLGPLAFLILLLIGLWKYSYPSGTGEEFQILQHQTLAAVSIGPGVELQISGENSAAVAIPLFIKIEHAGSNSYATRFNAERWVKPGRFKLYFPLQGLKSSNGAAFPADQPIIVTLFAREHDAGDIALALDIAVAPPLPGDVIALDFGPAGSPVFPGFEHIDASDPRLECVRNCSETRRPYSDVLIGDGVSGIAGLNLQAKPGRYLLMMWMEDTGEWETLPHHLERRIKINGEIRAYDRRTIGQWLAERYRKLPGAENTPAGSAWMGLGRYRGDPVILDIQTNTGRIDIEFAGDRAAATHLAGLVLVPIDKPGSLKTIEYQRQERYDSRWPVIKTPNRWEEILPENKPSGLLARDGLVFLHLRLPATSVGFHLHAPAYNGAQLSVDVWRISGSLSRVSPNAEFLTLDSRILDPVDRTAVFAPGDYLLRLRNEDNLPAGLFRGRVTEQGKTVVSFAVRAVDIDRPAPSHFISAYLEELPMANRFPDQVPAESQCFRKILRDFHLQDIAVPSKPDQLRATDVMAAAMVEVSRRTGFTAFSYAQPKDLRLLFGQDETFDRLAAVSRTVASYGGQVTWSIADEPVPGQFPAIGIAATEMRARNPAIRLAGHLNAPGQQALMEHFDILIANQGFGINRSLFDRAGQMGKQVWLYNMDHPQLAAGLQAYLFGAGGYLQWHAFMPTAHPLDPTDGREGDVFLVHPSRSACAKAPILDRRLIELALAQEDAAWLAWLEEEAADEIAVLRARMPDRVEGEFENWVRLKEDAHETISHILNRNGLNAGGHDG
ncbi:hypothetical protein [Aestuariispira insulae]|uniref:Uncharacterized protein n=1 Tax=Aestuariispira insulae TaxID=1461337 RepID=A0A3D9H2U8_9PROT|nr:hypothetical protein [Aestuariispira insulae]RED43802.1 hypothetical protein DFP90_11825 [Aestuariispira insulae]